MTAITFETLNLDGLSESELWAFWSTYHRSGRKLAFEFFGGGPSSGFTKHVDTLRTLANYACNKSVAMGCRTKGDIIAALCYEKAADLCFQSLPSYARW